MNTPEQRDDKATQEPPERSVVDLIMEIRSGKTDPRSLAPGDRQACVAHLRTEGLSVPEIAQVLKCSDRTITRDRKALQEIAALAHDPKLAGRIAGQLVVEAGVCIDRIRRVSRDRDTPPNVKVDAERGCFQILAELTRTLQSLGYLPAAAQRLEADLSHRVADVPTIEVIEGEFRRIKQVTQHYEGRVPPGLQELETIITRAALAERVGAASAGVAGGDGSRAPATPKRYTGGSAKCVVPAPRPRR
jgi:hypothetical protein